jgi:excisionase family DNA binding protein
MDEKTRKARAGRPGEHRRAAGAVADAIGVGAQPVDSGGRGKPKRKAGREQVSTNERGPGILWGVPAPIYAGEEVSRVEDKNRTMITITEAAEYLGLTRTTVQDMVERGVIKAERFAGAIHIARQEVERIEGETAP